MLRASVLALAALFLPLPLAAASSEAAAARPTVAAPPVRTDASSGRPVPSGEETGPVPRLWGAFVTFTNVFDTNIDHDDVGLDAYGVVVGTGLLLQTSADRPLLQVEYEVARHSFAQAPQWDRVSHSVRAALERRVTRRLTIATAGEASLKGSTEDRELSDQFVVEPRIDLRLNRENRLRLFGAHRLKRYPAARTERDATNRYAGIELRRRAETGQRWTIGYRKEANEAAGLRYQYDRDTFYAEHINPLPGRGSLELKIKYRSQRYRHRLVEVGDADVPRHDRRWIPRVSWLQPVASRLDVELGYTFETRLSNDVDRNFQAHYASLMLRAHW